MGRLLLCAGVLALLVVAFSAEAARHHENFSQGTYYDQTQEEKEKPVRVETEEPTGDDKTSTETPIDPTVNPGPDDTTIHDRYPNGYPGQEHYNTQLMTDDNDPEAQFSGYKNTNVQYNTVGTDSTDDKQTIPNRYPDGYPGSENPLYSNDVDPEAKFKQAKYMGFSSQVHSNDENTEIPNRYPSGYYGNADVESRTQGEGDVFVSHKFDKRASYSTELHNSNADDKSQVASHERYPYGYYPEMNGYSDVSTDGEVKNFKQNQYSSQQYPGNQPRYGYEGIQGDFSTQLGQDIPFELTGGACPSQYWVSNPQKWPKFFNINSKVVDAFGNKAGKVYGETSLLDGLTDTRADPYSELVNGACTAILNSYSRAQYKLKHTEVIELFNAALDSPEAAKTQAEAFKQANVSVFSAGIEGSCT